MATVQDKTRTLRANPSGTAEPPSCFEPPAAAVLPPSSPGAKYAAAASMVRPAVCRRISLIASARRAGASGAAAIPAAVASRIGYYADGYVRSIMNR